VAKKKDEQIRINKEVLNFKPGERGKKTTPVFEAMDEARTTKGKNKKKRKCREKKRLD